MGGSDFFAAAGFDSFFSFFSFFSLFSPLSAFFSFFSPVDLSARAKTNASIAISHPSPSSSPLASSRVASRAFVSCSRPGGHANESRVFVVVRRTFRLTRGALFGRFVFFTHRARRLAREEVCGGERRASIDGDLFLGARVSSRAGRASGASRRSSMFCALMCVNKSRSLTRYLSRRLVIR